MLITTILGALLEMRIVVISLKSSPKETPRLSLVKGANQTMHFPNFKTFTGRPSPYFSRVVS